MNSETNFSQRGVSNSPSYIRISGLSSALNQGIRVTATNSDGADFVLPLIPRATVFRPPAATNRFQPPAATNRFQPPAAMNRFQPPAATNRLPASRQRPATDLQEQFSPGAIFSRERPQIHLSQNRLQPNFDSQNDHVRISTPNLVSSQRSSPIYESQESEYGDEDDDWGEFNQSEATGEASSSKTKKKSRKAKNPQAEQERIEKEQGRIEKERLNRDLIDLVREHELLWNFHLDDHKLADECERSWRDIAEALNTPGFDWCTCQKRFEMLRASFKRELDKLGNPPPTGSAYEDVRGTIKWKYFGALEFLKDTFAQRRTVSSWSRSSLTPNSMAGDISLGDEASSVDGSFTSGNKKNLKRKRVEAEGSLLPPEATAGFTLACNKMASYFDNNSSDARPEAIRDPNVILGETIVSELASYSADKQRKLRRQIRQAVDKIFEEEDL